MKKKTKHGIKLRKEEEEKKKSTRVIKILWHIKSLLCGRLE